MCSICTAPPEVRALIDHELSKAIGTRKPLRVLAALGGFSKSALSRHDRNCLSRARLEAFRDRRKKSNRIGRIVVKDSSTDPPVWTWHDPFDEHFGDPQLFNPREGFKPDDLFLEITQEPLRAEVLLRVAASSRKAPQPAAAIEIEDAEDETEEAL